MAPDFIFVLLPNSGEERAFLQQQEYSLCTPSLPQALCGILCPVAGTAEAIGTTNCLEDEVWVIWKIYGVEPSKLGLPLLFYLYLLMAIICPNLFFIALYELCGT